MTKKWQIKIMIKKHWFEAAQVQIAGPSEVHVRQGSTLSLTCSLSSPQEADSALLWYHDDRLIELENARGAMSLATERSDHFISSRLLLPRASAQDGGNYSCRPTRALPVSVLVHVLNGNLTSKDKAIATPNACLMQKKYNYISNGCCFLQCIFIVPNTI